MSSYSSGRSFYYNASTKVCYRHLGFMGYPNYRVGFDGSIWGLGRWDKTRWKLMKPNTSGRYWAVDLWNTTTKTSSRFPIGYLILFAFVGPRPVGMECCHTNGKATDNRLENLRWDTHRNNMKDKERCGTWQGGERNGCAKITDEIVNKIWDLWENGVLHRDIAKQLGLKEYHVGRILTGKGWKHLARTRDRNEDGTTLRRPSPRRGESGTGSKLSWDEVDRIRDLHRKGCSYNELGRRFGVSSVAIGNIIKNKTWKPEWRKVEND